MKVNKLMTGQAAVGREADCVVSGQSGLVEQEHGKWRSVHEPKTSAPVVLDIRICNCAWPAADLRPVAVIWGSGLSRYDIGQLWVGV